MEESRTDPALGLIPATERTRLTEAERNRATVTRLLDILRGESPIESGVDLIAQDVVANVDGSSISARVSAWTR